MEYLKRFAIGCTLGLIVVALCAMVYFAGTALLIAAATNPGLAVVGFALVFVLAFGALHSLLGG